jgi:hypothetical protein
VVFLSCCRRIIGLYVESEVGLGSFVPSPCICFMIDFPSHMTANKATEISSTIFHGVVAVIIWSRKCQFVFQIDNRFRITTILHYRSVSAPLEGSRVSVVIDTSNASFTL